MTRSIGIVAIVKISRKAKFRKAVAIANLLKRLKTLGQLPRRRKYKELAGLEAILILKKNNLIYEPPPGERRHQLFLFWRLLIDMKLIMENWRKFNFLLEKEDKISKYRDDQGRIYKVWKRKPQTGGYSPEKIEAAIKSGRIPASSAEHWRAKAAGKGGEWQFCEEGTCDRFGADTDKEFYEFLKTLECITEPNCIKIKKGGFTGPIIKEPAA